MRRQQLPTIVLVVMSVALEATVLYRSATQSITFDEAGTYLTFMRGPFRAVLTNYDASNHALFTALARVSVHVLGPSEFSLRLPSALAAGLFFAAIALLHRLVHGRGIVTVLAAAAVALNPFLLDLLSAARGYGLALAFLASAIWCLTIALQPVTSRRRWLAIASVLLGLSVSAQLTFTFPAVALVLTTGAALGAKRETAWAVLPGLVIAAIILAVPLLHMRPGAFYWGAQTPARAIASLAQPVLEHRTPTWACEGPVAGEHLSPLAAVVCAVAIAMIASALAAIIRNWPANGTGLSAPARLTLLVSASLLLTVTEIVAARYVFGVRYPEGRTGAYLVLLFSLAATGASALLLEDERTKRVGVVSAAFLAAVCIWFLSEFTVRYFYDWRFDAGTRRIAEILVERSHRLQRPVRVWASDLQPSLAFYTIVRAFPLDLVSEVDTRPRTSYDFFVACSDPERAMTQSLGTPVYVDPTSNAVVLERKLSASTP